MFIIRDKEIDLEGDYMQRINMFEDKDLRELPLIYLIGGIVVECLACLLIIIISGFSMRSCSLCGLFILPISITQIISIPRTCQFYLRKIIFFDSRIQINSFKDVAYHRIDNKRISDCIKCQVRFPIYHGKRREKECIVLCINGEQLEGDPEYRLYFNNKNFIFIENRPGLESLLNQYLPHIQIEKKD
ncbi:MAG: hypothetical protein IKA72_02700 [Clostridia bacterium]|nr:hypothetical protein [Clostridia bacterium]